MGTRSRSRPKRRWKDKLVQDVEIRGMLWEYAEKEWVSDPDPVIPQREGICMCIIFKDNIKYKRNVLNDLINFKILSQNLGLKKFTQVL